MKKLSHIVAHAQAQPVHIRKTILLSLSIGVTALIVVLWLSFLAFSHRPTTVSDDGTLSTSSPFAIIKDSVVELYATATKGNDSTQQ
jgi:hypothetical protein